MHNIFFLSIYEQYVSSIVTRHKQWEFRKNPRFGILPDKEIRSDDLIFLIRTYPADSNCHPTIDCMCRVGTILRGDGLKQYFQDKKSGNWKEAGCDDKTERDWQFFLHSILDVYSTAIKLIPYKIDPAIDVTTIRHRVKNTPWKGKGFTPLENLKRFAINGADIPNYFEHIALKTLENKLHF